MTAEAIILSSKISEPIDSNLGRLTEFLGPNCRFVQVDDGQGSLDNLSKDVKSKDLCVMVSSKTLAKMLSAYDCSDYLKEFLFKQASSLFVYGMSPGDLDSSAVKFLTDGLVSSISAFDRGERKYDISPDLRHITRQFSGISFGPIRSKTDFALEAGNNSGAFTNIISIDDKPFFTTFKRDNCTVFLVACSQIADINKTIGREFNTKEYFSQLIPPMMFLKHVLEDRCWHNAHNYARFMMDDPLLRESYGFLNYRQLLGVMDQRNFASTVAFIPWNRKRTSRSIAKLFRERPDRLSICIHGCDHTRGEFGIRDIGQLNSKVRLAKERMIAHERLTGVPFVDVMVFPQGVFSTEALKSLKCNNYLAAVNSMVVPLDQKKAEVLKLSDHLGVAVMNYESFPLFRRRYPGEAIDFAFDLFLGKPSLIVEHHSYFKEGYEKITELIRAINSLGQIRWDGFEQIIKNSYLQRRVSDGKICCRIYASSALIKNTYGSTQEYVITKNETNNVPIEQVSVNGQKVPYVIENNQLTLSVEIAPESSADVRITYRNAQPYSVDKRKLRQRIRVSLRRLMSEFRDTRTKFTLTD